MSECPNVHDVQMPMMSKCPLCPNVHDVVTLVTCGYTCHMWSHFSHAVTIVTGGLMCHIWSHMVTLVKETNVSTADQNVSSLTEDETRPMYTDLLGRR